MSEVFWIDNEGMSAGNTVEHKLKKLITETGATDQLEEGMRVAIKINTSEEGYEYGLRPIFIRIVAEEVKNVTVKSAILCDGVKIIDYRSKSHSGNAFQNTARGKGYSDTTLSGNFVINGGFSGDEANSYPVKTPDSLLGGVEVGTAICRTDALMVLSHVTLHPLFGLSGALFNGGFESLICKERIRILEGINPYLFSGPPPKKELLERFQRRATEGLMGVREAMGEKVFYINYLWDVTAEPEYYPYSNLPIAPNMGFLASLDPVALDAATYSLLREFSPDRDLVDYHTGVDFPKVLNQAAALGLGSLDYVIKRSS
jgi:uncharacterized Fe-S center protein